MSRKSLTFPDEVCKGATGDVSEGDVYLFSFSFYENQALDRPTNLFGCLINVIYFILISCLTFVLHYPSFSFNKSNFYLQMIN